MVLFLPESASTLPQRYKQCILEQVQSLPTNGTIYFFATAQAPFSNQKDVRLKELEVHQPLVSTLSTSI